MKSLSLATAFIAALIPFQLACAGQLNLPVQKLLPPYPAASDLWFGNDVDIDGPHLVVSSPTSANSGGAAYVYELGPGGWAYQATLASPSLNDEEYFFFGRKAAVSGGGGAAPARVMVSSDGGGRLFEKSGANWSEVALFPGGYGAGYGNVDVAVAGDVAVSVVSQPGARAFQFQGGAWNAGATLSPVVPDGSGLDGSFGEEIVIDGDYVFVSAASQDHSTINSGAVFVYKIVDNQLVSAKTVGPPNPVFRGSFGYGIDADDGTLVVGRPGGSPSANGPIQGLAYIYENFGDDWSETARLQASDGFPGDSFGSKVAISGNFAAVSSWSAADGGRVYLFRRDLAGWNELGWLKTGEPFPEDQFGISLKLDGRHLVIGARIDSQIGSDAGAVYVYAIPEPSAWSIFVTGVAAILTRFRWRRRLQSHHA